MSTAEVREEFDECFNPVGRVSDAIIGEESSSKVLFPLL
jgi:hypothetical protein